MRRKMGKKLLILLMSAALMSANTCFVYAEEESSSKSEESSSKSESSSSKSESSSSKSESSSSKSEESSSKSESTSSKSESSSDDTKKSESSESTDKKQESESSNSETSKENKTSEDGETSKENKTSEDGETSKENKASEDSETSKENKASEDSETSEENKTSEDSETSEENKTSEDGETSEEKTAEDGTLEGENTEGAAAEEGENGTDTEQETLFVNKDGEEITPSKLVGTDYTTISESYDGEMNVIKKYAVSEEYGANTIMESYVDEDGNLIMVISQGSDAVMAVSEEDEEKEEKSRKSEKAPAVDGSFSGWDDIPVSYEYNWDNSQNCWVNGVWVDGQKYTTQTGTYNTDVRHGMQMFADDENVYLNITFAREFSTGQKANGNDYQFWVDGKMAAYQVEWSDGSSLSNSSAEPGTYQVDVRHRDSSWSYVLTDGAVAYYHVNEGNVNNQLELRIPLSEFVKQNGDINLDNYSMIQFFSPNLMYNRISAAGSPTGSIPFAAGAFLLVPASYIWLKKKNDKGEAFA